MKKLLLTVVILFAAVSVLWAAGGKEAETGTSHGAASSINEAGKYEPPISVTAVNVRVAPDVKFPEGKGVGDNIWIDTYREELGIDVDVLWGNDDIEKFNLMLASGDLPDIFGINNQRSNAFDELIEAGKLQDLTASFEQHASPLLKEMLYEDGGRAMEACTRNGKLYSIPYYEDTSGQGMVLWVREDWRKKLNLPEPDSLQDVFKISTAFAKEDPDGNGKDDTYGMYLNEINNDPWLTMVLGFFNGYHAYPNIWVKTSSGKIESGRIQPEMKEALARLQKMYAAGEIPQEFPLIKSENWEEDTAAGKYGLIYGADWFPEWPFQLLKNNDPSSEWKAYPVPSIDNKPAKVSVAGLSIGFHFVERNGIEHPEAIIKLANIAAEKMFGENADPDNYYVDPETYSNIWKYTVVSIARNLGTLKDYQAVKLAMADNNPAGLNKSARIVYDKIMNFKAGETGDWWYYGQYGPDGSMRVIEKYIEEQDIVYSSFYGIKPESMVKKEAVLDKLFNQMMVKIIMGEDISEFDNFVNEWKKLGGNEVTEDVNKWYRENVK